MLTVRNATLEDAKRILEIYDFYVKHTAITFEYRTPSLKEFQARMKKIMRRYPYLVILNGDRIEGYTYAGPFVGRAAYDWSCEVTIYLDHDAQKQGMGRMLYEALETAVQDMGIRNMYACIGYPDRNDEYLTTNSADFHAHVGYEKVGEFHKCGYKFNRWYNMIWMEKVIGGHETPQPPVIPYPELANRAHTLEAHIDRPQSGAPVDESPLLPRCKWCKTGNPLYVRYHDSEWGVPCHDEHTLYELLILESFQAGLSWETVLNKRARFREVYDNFDIDKVCAYGEDRIALLSADKGIIRNRMKIRASIRNSRIFREIQKEYGSFDAYIWGWTGGRTVYEGNTAVTTSPLSDAISKDLKKRGMTFVGSTIIYAYLQAIGIINAHADNCFLHRNGAYTAQESEPEG